MRQRHLPALTLAIAILIGAPCAAASRVSAKLIRPGTYHGDEVPTRSGDRWLGVTISSAGTTIAPTRVAIEKVHDEVVDKPHEKTGKRVRATRGHPFFLVRDVAGVRPGTAVTVQRFDPAKPLAPEQELPFTLAGASWSLVARTVDAPTKSASAVPIRLVARRGSESVTVVVLPQGIGPEHARGVLWIGDLNRDGRPDFLIDVSDHYNVLEPALFLSRGGRSGWRYERVASFRTTGC